MKADIECTVEQCSTCLEDQQTQPQGKALHYEIPCRPWEMIGANVFMINGKNFCVL